MFMKFFPVWVLALSVATPSLSYAGDWSIGINAGRSSTEFVNDECENLDQRIDVADLGPQIAALANNITSISCDGDGDASAKSIDLAYHFGPKWGVEIGYADLGLYETDVNVAISVFNIDLSQTIPDLEISAHSYYLVATRAFYLTQKLSLIARLGVAHSELEGRFQQQKYEDESVDVSYGAELRYQATEPVSINLRFNSYGVGEVDALTAGFRYHF